jgi:TonB family protein
MEARVQTEGWNGRSRRRVPRFEIQTPVDLTVLRLGVPDTVPGRSVDVCERGLAAIVAGELVTGESVGVELELPPLPEPLRTRALVRYQDRLRCGLEFVALSAEQRASIRDWTREARAAAQEIAVAIPADTTENNLSDPGMETGSRVGQYHPDIATPNRPRMWRLVAVGIIFCAAGLWWWRWNHAWRELEFGVKSSQVSAAESHRQQVPAEVMQKLLVHRVEPVYPPEARAQRLEGTIALDIVIGRDGSVESMQALNGPDVLARAAMDALRWWKFEPYRINGKPTLVETTVAVEFKR